MLRAKNKSNAGKDFVKAKAKAGKKIIRSNETKINLKTKKIHLPTQLSSSLVETSSLDSNEMAIKLQKLLHHHNSNVKIQALRDIKVFLINNKEEENYLALLFPDILETLFTEDNDLREVLLDTVSAIFSSFNNLSFVSILPIIITFLCSGMNHVDKV